MHPSCETRAPFDISISRSKYDTTFLESDVSETTEVITVKVIKFISLETHFEKKRLIGILKICIVIVTPKSKTSYIFK